MGGVEDLLSRCLKNDRSAQEELYRMFADKMYNVAIIYTKDEDDACDVLQEGFIKVFKNLDRFSNEGSFEGWVRRIIVNTALELYRKKQAESENKTFYSQHLEVHVNNIIENLSAKEIIRKVNNLPSKAQMVLKLFAIEGYSHKEIASQLAITEGTSKSQLNYARQLLKEEIEKEQ